MITPLLRNLIPKWEFSPQLSISARSLSFSSSPSFLSSQTQPILFPRGPELGELPSFHTVCRPVSSDNRAVSSEGHLLTLADVSIPLPVRFPKLAPSTGLECRHFDSLTQVLLVPECPPGMGRWSHSLWGSQGTFDQGCDNLDTALLSLSISQQSIPQKRHGVEKL